MRMISFPSLNSAPQLLSHGMRAIEIANTQRTSMLSHNFDLMPSHKSSVLSAPYSAPSGAVVRLFCEQMRGKKKRRKFTKGGGMSSCSRELSDIKSLQQSYYGLYRELNSDCKRF
jgi:hypothetical protein